MCKINFNNFLMKGVNLVNMAFLVLCADCKDLDTQLKALLDYLDAHSKEFSANRVVCFGLLFVVAVCIPAAIFGGLYVYRNCWRSLVPQSKGKLITKNNF